MKDIFIPQFKVEDLYISPFKTERHFHPDTGKVVYVPIEQNLTPTGVHLFDHFLQIICLSRKFSYRNISSKLGVPMRDFTGMTYVLTGMSMEEIYLALRMRLADDLLRYTELPLVEISERCGFGTVQGMYKMFQKAYKTTPTLRQIGLRNKGDAGRYGV